MTHLFNNPYLLASIGGGLIGISAGLYYLFLGRIFGISGFIFSLFEKPVFIRIFSILGLLSAGLILNLIGAFNEINQISPLPILALAGFLVGYGSKLGNGCTSGHGICGISRFSKRSIVSVIIFISSAIITLLLKSRLGF